MAQSPADAGDLSAQRGGQRHPDVSPPARTTHRPRTYGDSVIALYRAAAATVVVGTLLAGCGSGPAPVAAPATAASTVPPVPTSATVELPWPAPGAAEAAALQTQVDSGSQSWLLDPTELALSYVAAAHGWTGADATPSASTGGGAGRGTVDVRASDGRGITLTVTQPGRTGNGGIWVVIAENAA